MKKISDAMKREDPALAEKLRMRDDLAAELKTKEELIRQLREELRVKEAYILGMLESNPNAAPTADFLESIIS
jgi:hypothetical protein